MNRIDRLALELGYFTPSQLDTLMCLGDFCGELSPLEDLSREAYDCSATAAINDTNRWGCALRETITDMVSLVYCVDGITYDTLEGVIEACQAD
jgi:O-succinylbenzoate synthase